jgi:uncharacterized protein
MSQENIEIVRRGFEAGNRRDVEALIEVLDPEVEWHSALLKALEGKAAMYRGHEGIREFFRDLDELFDMLHAEYPEIRDLGDRVVGIGRIRMRGKGSGAETESPICSVVDFKNGKAIRVRTYLDPKEALEAGMLTEQPIPQQHIDITLRQVDAVNRRDAEAFVATVSPDVEWEDALYWSDVSRTYRGRAEVREWFNEVVVEPWDSLQCGVEEVAEAADDRLFFGGLLTACARDGVETQLHFWSVTWIADGSATRRRVFRDRDEALEAAGLRE